MKRLFALGLLLALAGSAFAQDQRAHQAAPNLNFPRLGIVRNYSADIKGANNGVVCSGYTLIPADTGKFFRCTDAGSATITAPATLPYGFQIAIEQDGAGQITVSAGSGATLHAPHSFAGKTAGQYSIIGLTVVQNAGGAAIYVLSGDGA